MHKFDIGNEIKNMVSAAEFRLPCGTSVRAISSQKNPFVEISANVISRDENSLEMEMVIRNLCDHKLQIDRLIPAYLDGKSGGQTALGIHVPNWIMLAGGNFMGGARDLCWLSFTNKVRSFYASNYTMLGNRSVGKYQLFGFKNFSRQDSHFELHIELDNMKFNRFLACCDPAGSILEPGATINSEPLLVRVSNDPYKLITSYADELADKFCKGREFKDIVGWSTWDYYQEFVTEKDVLENVEYLAKHRDTLPIEYIQIDDGYELLEGEWLKTNKKFPNGLKYLADRIHKAGFKAGLWICPFLAAPESSTAKEHPEWLLRDRTGKPLILNGFVARDLYGLDCSAPGVTDYMYNLAHTITAEYGFDYLKFDGANRQVLSKLGVPSNPAMGSGEAMRMGLEAFRRGMKPGSLLLGGSTFGIAMGISNAMRIGEDTGARWDASKIAKDWGERDRFDGPGEVLRAIAATTNHFYLHKKVWVNDPDYLVVRQEGMNSELSLEEARSWASVIALSNGTIMLADPPEKLLPERLEIVEKTIPHSPHPARPIDFFRKNVPSILAMPVENKSEEYLVVSVTNTDIPKRDRDYKLNFAELGLEPDQDYLFFEFWTSKFYGKARNSFTVKQLPPHMTRVFAIRKNTGKCQLLGTDTHISMGGVEIASFDGKALSVNKRGRKWKAFFYVPDGAQPPKALEKVSDNCYALEIPPEKTVISLNGDIVKCCV